MGRYINIGNVDFSSVRNGEYVDKSAAIQIVNETLDTELRYSCVTRCRRFGKSMTARMLNAYYDKSCDSRHLFEDLAVARMPSFEEHLNKYPTIFVDMTDFTTEYRKNPDIVKIVKEVIKEDLQAAYPDVKMKDSCSLMEALFTVADSTKERFMMIIDEWDAICREFDNAPEVVDEYVDLLRNMFKSGMSGRVFVGVYMTGILPIKRYNTQSALNNFREYSMVMPGSQGQVSVTHLMMGRRNLSPRPCVPATLKVVECKDDVLTVLIHLGYLSYDYETKTCRIPNKEVAEQFDATLLRTGCSVYLCP